MMKNVTIILLAFFVLLGCKKENTKVLLKTTQGDIVLELFDEQTPLHAANFKKLVEQKYFDSLLFHRVIKDFMIQGGDPDSKYAPKDSLLGEGGPGYTIEAEFRIPEIFHKRGVLAAAREGDDVNPNKESCGSQFYIVWGKIFDDQALEEVQKRITQRTDGKVVLTDQMKQVYKTIGGTPHLDGSYTIFGQVLSGLEVVNAIQQVSTDSNDRPIEDVRIISAEVL